MCSVHCALWILCFVMCIPHYDMSISLCLPISLWCIPIIMLSAFSSSLCLYLMTLCASSLCRALSLWRDIIIEYFLLATPPSRNQNGGNLLKILALFICIYRFEDKKIDVNMINNLTDKELINTFVDTHNITKGKDFFYYFFYGSAAPKHGKTQIKIKFKFVILILFFPTLISFFSSPKEKECYLTFRTLF